MKHFEKVFINRNPTEISVTGSPSRLRHALPSEIKWWSPQFSSVAQSWTTPCDPMDCSTPGFPVHRQLPEPTQTHVHWVGDANYGPLRKLFSQVWLLVTPWTIQSMEFSPRAMDIQGIWHVHTCLRPTDSLAIISDHSLDAS